MTNPFCFLFIELHFKHPFVDRMNNKCGNIREDAEIIGKFPHFYRKEDVISWNFSTQRHQITSFYYLHFLLLSKNILHGASITLTSQMPCLRFANAMFTLSKCHVYNLQAMVFWLTNKLCKGWKNFKTEAFLPRFCINIQNDRKTANKALRFQNAQNYS